MPSAGFKCAQDFRCLPGPKFLAMLDAVHLKPERRQELRHPFNRSPPPVGEAALRVLGLGFGGPVLDQVELHDLIFLPSDLRTV